jgi:BirA family biotin operon repressor/biotin-[acetyl-CoA-carboxylase] ligase
MDTSRASPIGVQPLSWSAEALWQTLEPLLPGISVEVVASCSSTNAVLIERARQSSGWHDQPISGPMPLDPPTGARPTPHGRRAGDSQPCLLVAEHQTQGRGRSGRPWQSTHGSSLTFSLSLPLAPADWSGLSLAVGVALADALDPPAGDAPPRVGLKWPNDLWILDGPGRGRKLGGVLIETVTVGHNRMAVIGIGLNVLPQAYSDLSSGYASLLELDAGVTAPKALHRVARALVQALQRYEREGFAAFAEAFDRRDLLRGRPVLTTASGVREGVSLGVGRHGALRVRTADGREHEITSGDVSVRPGAAVPGP